MNVHKVVVPLIVATLIGTPISAAKRDPETLAPSSPWNVNYADDSCRLGRAFGTGDQTTYIVFDRFAPGQKFKLLAAGKRFGSIGSSDVAEFRFGPNEMPLKAEFFKGDLGKQTPALILRGDLRVDFSRFGIRAVPPVQPEPISVERIAAVKELEIGRPLRHPVRIALGSMRAPFAALDKCIDDLLVRWGVDPAEYGTLSRHVAPEGDPGQWMQYSDYPELAVRRGAQGVVEFRLNVDASGKPSACHIQQSTRPPEFDVAVCKNMMRRARFAPALDKTGKAVPSFFRSTVTFAMSSAFP